MEASLIPKRLNAIAIKMTHPHCGASIWNKMPGIIRVSLNQLKRLCVPRHLNVAEPVKGLI
jgi:hypothetical protein